MQALQSSLNDEEVILKDREKVIKAELSGVEPLIRKAQESVGGIKNEQLSEVRSLRAPPPVVKDILEGVLKLMGNNDTSWTGMKTFLGKRTVKEEIMNFDARNITAKIKNSVQQLINEKPDSFDEVNAKKSSVACAPLASWVKALIAFSSVLEGIAPMEQSLKQLQDKLKASQNKVQELSDGLALVDENVKGLKQDFALKTSEAAELQAGLERNLTIIKKSAVLLQGLEGEQSRWTQSVKELSEKLSQCPQRMRSAAQKILYRSSEAQFQLLSMTTAKERLNWKLAGLPQEEKAEENALKLTLLLDIKTPLLLDPTRRGTQWLSQIHNVELVSLYAPNLIRQLELAIRFGKRICVTEMDRIPSFLCFLLRKGLRTIVENTREVVYLGDKALEAHPDFKLFLSSERPHCEVSPDVVDHLQILDFTMTQEGTL